MYVYIRVFLRVFSLVFVVLEETLRFIFTGTIRCDIVLSSAERDTIEGFHRLVVMIIRREDFACS